jgi:hypothetical protein
VGTFGDATLFGFFPNKQMTTGEGGVVATNDSAWAALLRSLRNQGRDADTGRLQYSRLGFNYRLDAMSAALGLGQFRHLNVLLGKRARPWFYPPRGQPLQPAMTRSAASLPHGCLAVRFETGAVVTALDVDACEKLGIETGMSLIDVERLLGSPPESCWRYSWSPGDAHHRERVVCFSNARVAMMIRRWN